MNSVNILGRASKDPIIREFNGGSVANFSLAVDAFRKGQKETDFFEVKAFDNVAKTIQEHVQKGRQLAVSGRLEVEKWNDQQGAQRQKVVITAFQVTLLAKPKAQQTEADDLDGIFDGEE